MRGNQCGAGWCLASRGSIPAYAGEPGGCSAAAADARVYPRVCGGTYSSVSVCADWIGLSPRMRGNPSTPNAGVNGVRSIPAYAGEPTQDYDSGRNQGVYPRVCGGTIRAWRLAKAQQGLSPRMRGNPLYTLLLRMAQGSIPAYAGEPTD